jgi:hypothetical protein
LLQGRTQLVATATIHPVATRTGRVNYTTMEDILEGEQVLAGTFSINRHPIVILFDSGATHDFISKACTQRYRLAIKKIYTPFMIITSGGKIITKQIVTNTPLNLAGKVYKTGLIILDAQGIDVILGMCWMREHRALLDTTARVVHLDSPAIFGLSYTSFCSSYHCSKP